MIVGYDDDGPRVRLCHMPLRHLLLDRGLRRIPIDPRVKRRSGYLGGCLANWPYSLLTGNGHRPFGRRR